MSVTPLISNRLEELSGAGGVAGGGGEFARHQEAAANGFRARKLYCKAAVGTTVRSIVKGVIDVSREGAVCLDECEAKVAGSDERGIWRGDVSRFKRSR